MKSIKKNIITSMVLLLPLWFVACESEREVGSTLFPEGNSGDIEKKHLLTTVVFIPRIIWNLQLCRQETEGI